MKLMRKTKKYWPTTWRSTKFRIQKWKINWKMSIQDFWLPFVITWNDAYVFNLRRGWSRNSSSSILGKKVHEMIVFFFWSLSARRIWAGVTGRFLFVSFLFDPCSIFLPLQKDVWILVRLHFCRIYACKEREVQRSSLPLLPCNANNKAQIPLGVFVVAFIV
jgi:hypothetical protein